MHVVVRPRLRIVPGQEVLTVDGLSVRVSLTVACCTADQPALLQPRTLQAVEAGGATVHLSTAPAG